jgi:hypothetical protein
MAQPHYKALLRKVLLGFITEQDRFLAKLEWVAEPVVNISIECGMG